MRAFALLLLPLVLLSCGDGPSGPAPDPVTISTTSPLPDATVGVPYSATLAASGGSGSYGWSVSSGSLPAGLSLSAGGVLSGTPSAAGSSTFTVRATSGSLSGTKSLTIVIQPPDVVITTATLTGATAGTAYSQTLAASGGTGAYSWIVVDGALPAGLTLSTAGVISGTPSAGGTSNFTVQVTSGQRTATKALTLAVAFPAVVVTTSSLPDGTVGEAYNQTLAATGGSGSYTWTVVAGSLPAGLALAATGSITGSPTAAGTSNFTVQATSGAQTATRSLSIVVQLPAVVIGTTTLPEGTVGVAYSQSLAATGGTGSFTWSLASGALPGGLTLSAAGVIAGSPTAAGTSNFTVRATSGALNATRALTIVVQPPAVTITTTTLPPAIQGVAYNQTLAASGGAGSYTWSLSPGSTLPAGLALSSGGTISGTPTTAGSSTFTVQATSGAVSGTREFTLDVQGPAVVVTTTSLPSGTVGSPYSATLAASGGTGTYTWSVTGSLPAGLTLSTAGVIAGTPTAQGTSNFTVQATSGGQSATRALSITIGAALPAVQITTNSLAGGYEGEAYAVQLTATGGNGNYTWTVTGGTLPAGLSLSAAGAILGTPTAQGTSNFTVEAASAGMTDEAAFSITIDAPLPDVVITTASPLPAGTTGTAYSQTLSATGGNGTYTWSVVSGLPVNGLSLSGAGVISGSPINPGDVTFTVRATSGSKSVTKQFTVTIALAPVIITTASLPGGMVTVPYSQQLAATGGTGSYTWSLASGALPGGLTLSGAGLISGTPTAAGTFNFTVEATSGTANDTQALSIVVAVVPPVSITTTTVPNGTVGVAYSQTLVATGGTGTFTWTVSSGALPAGLSLSAAGVISGTPTTEATSNFTVQATSGGENDTQALSITVAVAPVVITTTTLPNGIVGTAYNQTLVATGGTGTFTWAVTVGTLPAGLSLSAGGAITGTPTTEGTSNFTVEATSGSQTDTQELSITVALPPVVITTTTLPGGTVSTAYNQTLVATGGTGTFTWAISAGALPAGLSLSAGGVISGTPSAGGTFNFTVQATSGSQSDTQALSIVVTSSGQITLNVGDSPTATVTAGQNIGIPISVDLSQRGTLDLASISVTISWDPTRFDFVPPATAGTWIDQNGDPASYTPVNDTQAAAGLLTFGGTTFAATTQSFVLRTVTLRAKTAGAATTVGASVNAAGNAGGTAVTVTPRDLSVTIQP